MAIIAKPINEVQPPNSLSSEAEGAVAVPNNLSAETEGAVGVPNALISETEGQVGLPNSLTSKIEGVVLAPNALSSQSEGVVGLPNSLSSQSEGVVAVPNALASETEGAVGLPNSLSSQSVANPSVPNNLTSQTAAAVSRALRPLVDMDFINQCYTQCGEPVLFEDLFTYSRNSSASFINRRIGCNGGFEYFLDTDFVGTVTNLFTFSEQFGNAAYSKANADVIDDVTQSPIGDITADKLTENSDSSSIHLLRRSESFTNGTDYTISIFVKPDERNQIAITVQAPAVAGGYRAIFDVNSGVILSRSQPDLPASIKPTDNGFFECSITFNADSTASANVEFELAKDGTVTYDGDGSSGLFIWGAQMTESAKPEPYVKTISVSDSLTFTESLRFEFDQETGDNLGAKNEGVITNLITKSELLDEWTTAGTITVTANDSKAPDETTSADLIDVASGGANRIERSVTTLTGDLTFSVYVKKVDISHVGLRLFELGGADVRADFNFSTLSFENMANVNDTTVKDVGNGFLRISIYSNVFTSSGVVTARLGGAITASQTGTKYLAFGLQGEALPFPTSYIRTEGSTVARAADRLDISAAGAIKDGEFTFHAVVNYPSLPSGGSGSNRYIYFNSGLSSTFSFARISTTGALLTQHGIPSSSLDSTPPNEFSVTTTVDVSGTLFNGYVDGINKTSITVTPFNVNVSSLVNIGHSSGGSNTFGHIKRLSFYEDEFTAQEVALL